MSHKRPSARAPKRTIDPVAAAKVARVAALIAFGTALAAWDPSSGAPRPVDPRATSTNFGASRSPWRMAVARPSEYATVLLSGTRGAR